MKIGYARVSTSEQNLSLQIDALTSAGCEYIFDDHGVSGATNDRAGLEETLNTVSAGDILIVWKLDRLGRSMVKLCQLIDSPSIQGVGFISLTDGIDTTVSAGKLMFHIIVALAEFERQLISERTKAGMQAAKLRGVHLGRPRLLTQNHRKIAVSMISAGHTRKSIARKMGVSINTLYRHLKSDDLSNT